MDCSPPGSSIHGILQARTLEWVAISSSRGIFSDPGIEPRSPALQADDLTSEHIFSKDLIRTWDHFPLEWKLFHILKDMLQQFEVRLMMVQGLNPFQGKVVPSPYQVLGTVSNGLPHP